MKEEKRVKKEEKIEMRRMEIGREEEGAREGKRR